MDQTGTGANDPAIKQASDIGSLASGCRQLLDLCTFGAGGNEARASSGKIGARIGWTAG